MRRRRVAVSFVIAYAQKTPGLPMNLPPPERARDLPHELDLANLMPQLAWTAEADGTIYWYNQRWYDYTGATSSS